MADAAGRVVALRGAFQDVSAHYHTQVALAATRDQLADSEQRVAEEHLLALRLQQAIMPPDEEPVEAAGIDVAVRYRPVGEGHLVGGDWYDALLLPSKDVLLVVGDVAGHGIDAVTGMVAARNSLRGLAITGAGPAELIRMLNGVMCDLTSGVVGTVVCGLYNPDTHVLRWARAGHLPPVLVRGGTAAELPLPGGVLLGMDPDAGYEEATQSLRPGDTLLLFTDGLIEQRGESIVDVLEEFVATLGMPRRPGADRRRAGRPGTRERRLRHRRRRLPGGGPHPLIPPRLAERSARTRSPGRGIRTPGPHFIRQLLDLVRTGLRRDCVRGPAPACRQLPSGQRNGPGQPRAREARASRASARRPAGGIQVLLLVLRRLGGDAVVNR